MSRVSCYFCQLAIDRVQDRAYVWQVAPQATAYSHVAVCRDCLSIHVPDTCACCQHRYKRNKLCKFDGVCDRCQLKMQRAVYVNRMEAKKHGGVYALTVKEWATTIRAFNYMCAYCQKMPYVLMEHFIPAIAGGGTSVNNCVPACHECNTRKRNKNPNSPDFRCSIPTVDIERVRQYLASPTAE